jgi:hypothetical protein
MKSLKTEGFRVVDPKNLGFFGQNWPSEGVKTPQMASSRKWPKKGCVDGYPSTQALYRPLFNSEVRRYPPPKGGVIFHFGSKTCVKRSSCRHFREKSAHPVFRNFPHRPLFCVFLQKRGRCGNFFTQISLIFTKFRQF